MSKAGLPMYTSALIGWISANGASLCTSVYRDFINEPILPCQKLRLSDFSTTVFALAYAYSPAALDLAMGYRSTFASVYVLVVMNFEFVRFTKQFFKKTDRVNSEESNE
ncbi:hypothetical protein GEMRC1_004913 [Eukaryota sp. GEM-RC1]